MKLHEHFIFHEKNQISEKNWKISKKKSEKSNFFLRIFLNFKMGFSNFYASHKTFENSFRKLWHHIIWSNYNWVVKRHILDSGSLNAPKISFLEQKVRFFEVLNFKIGAFKDQNPDQNSDHVQVIQMPCLTFKNHVQKIRSPPPKLTGKKLIWFDFLQFSRKLFDH